MDTKILITTLKSTRSDAFKNHLEDKGYQVEVAETTDDAFKMMEYLTYDLLLIDLDELTDDPLALVKDLHQFHPWPSQIVLASPETENRSTALKALRIGADDVIWKPIENWDNVDLILQRTLNYRDLIREGAHYRSLIDSFPGIIFWGDEQFAIRLIHGRVKELTGYDPEIFTEQRLKWSEIVFPEDLEASLEQIRKRLLQGQPAEVEYRLQRIDGEPQWVRNTLMPFMDEQKNIKSLSGIVIDIAERKRAEKALHESEKRYRLLFNSGSDMAFVSELATDGTTGRLLAVNDAACQTLGYTREELLHSSPLYLVAHQDRQDIPKLARQFFAEQRVLFEMDILTKEGRPIPVEVHTQRFELDGQTVVLSFARDISERKQVEQTLRQRLQEQETLFAIGQLVSSSLQIDEVMQLIAEQMAHLVDASSCAILNWRNHSRSHPEPVEGTRPEPVEGTRPHLPRQTQPGDTAQGILTVQAEYVRPTQTGPQGTLGETQTSYRVSRYPTIGNSLQDRQPFIIYAHDPKASVPERQLLQTHGWYGMAGIPLVVRDRVTGLAAVFLSRKDRPFSSHDLRLLQALANQVAVAIENARLYAAAQADKLALRDLSLRLINVQEQERRLIAQELHDELGQNLTAIKINIDLARRKNAQQYADLPSDVAASVNARLKEAGDLTDKLLTNVRAMTLELRPTLLDDLGIVPTLRWYSERFATHTGIKIELQISDLPRRLQPELETTIYRIVQEALTNVARHAQASHVQVSLDFHTESGMIVVLVGDDGKGFNVNAWAERSNRQQTLGLVGIHERVMLLDGDVNIQSQPGQGTQIEARLPVQFREEETSV